MPCREGEWVPRRWCLWFCGQGPAGRDTLSPHVCVFASLTDQVREKKDVPLGPEDPKEEDGSFDYRWVVSLAPVGTQCPSWVAVLTALSRALPSAAGVADGPLS